MTAGEDGQPTRTVPCVTSHRGRDGALAPTSEEAPVNQPTVAVLFSRIDVAGLPAGSAAGVRRWGPFALFSARQVDGVRQDAVLPAAAGWVLTTSAADASPGGFPVRQNAGLTLEPFTQAVAARLAARDWMMLAMPARMLSALPERAAKAGGIPVAGVGARLVADHLTTLGHLLPSARASDLPLLAEATRSLLDACLRRRDAAYPGGEGAGTSAMRATVHRVILENLGSARLDTMRICELSGLSRSALYRLFGNSGGVAAYVRHLRLAFIREELANPARAHVPIAKIAEQHGLFCTPSFNRAFRRAFGKTPGDVRTEALTRDAPTTPQQTPAGQAHPEGARPAIAAPAGAPSQVRPAIPRATAVFFRQPA